MIPTEKDPANSAVQNKVFLNFHLAELKDGISRHTIQFQTSAAAELLASPKIGILLVSNWKSGEVVSATMVFSDPASGAVTAKYSVKKGSWIRENRKLEFRRKGPPPPDGLPGPRNVSITISSRVGTDLAVVAQFSEGEPISRFLWMPSTSPLGKAGFASAWGWREKPEAGESLSKARLLACTWGLGTGGDRIVYSLILMAGVLWLLGVLALTHPASNAASAKREFCAAVGAGLLFLGPGVVFCVIFPPFQAPDEPDHFLTYAALANREVLATDALQLANAGHFERIKFRTDEKFSSVDVDRPEVDNWAPHVVPTDPNRSLLTSRIWSFAGAFLDGHHSGLALLSLRLINILFVSACLVCSLLLASYALRPDHLSIFMAAPVILTPGITFFSMGVSNYPFLIGGYVMQAISLGLLWAQPAESSKSQRLHAVTGVLAGAGIVLSVCSGDNGVFSIAFWAVLIPAYWFLQGLRADGISSGMKPGLWFFGAFFSSMLFVAAVVASFTGSFRILPAVMMSRFPGFLSSTPLRFLGTVGSLFLGFAVSLILISLFCAYAGSIFRNAGWLAVARKCAVFAMLLGIIYILFFGTSRVPDFSLVRGPVYILKVIGAFFEGFGPRESDWLITQSFWGIFGWLDTPMPAMLTGALRCLAGLGLVALFLASIRTRRFSCGIGFLAANLVSLLAMLCFIAAGYFILRFGVNGRYLIGPYLLILASAYEGYRRTVSRVAKTSSGTLLETSGVCLLCAAVQLTAWVSIINRYF